MSSNDPTPPTALVAAPEPSTSRPPTPVPVQSANHLPEATRDHPSQTYPTTEAASASARTSFTRVDVGGTEERSNELVVVRPLPPSNEMLEVVPHESPSPLGTVPESDFAPEPKTTDEIASESESAPPPISEPVLMPVLEPVPQTPQTLLTFLLVSGRRRTMSFEPDTTVGRVKELVWNAWPSGVFRAFTLMSFGRSCDRIPLGECTPFSLFYSASFQPFDTDIILELTADTTSQTPRMARRPASSALLPPHPPSRQDPPG